MINRFKILSVLAILCANCAKEKAAEKSVGTKKLAFFALAQTINQPILSIELPPCGNGIFSFYGPVLGNCKISLDKKSIQFHLEENSDQQALLSLASDLDNKIFG